MLTARVEFIRSGKYREFFRQDAANICYVVVGNNQWERIARMKALARWTMDVLKEQNRESWARIFRFSQVDFDDIYNCELFEKKSWLLLAHETPGMLFS